MTADPKARDIADLAARLDEDAEYIENYTGYFVGSTSRIVETLRMAKAALAARYAAGLEAAAKKAEGCEIVGKRGPNPHGAHRRIAHAIRSLKENPDEAADAIDRLLAKLNAAEASKIELAEHLGKVVALAAAEVERANEAASRADALEAALRKIKTKVYLWFEVPSEHESEPIPFHKGWEICVRAIANAIDASLLPGADK